MHVGGVTTGDCWEFIPLGTISLTADPSLGSQRMRAGDLQPGQDLPDPIASRPPPLRRKWGCRCSARRERGRSARGQSSPSRTSLPTPPPQSSRPSSNPSPAWPSSTSLSTSVLPHLPPELLPQPTARPPLLRRTCSRAILPTSRTPARRARANARAKARAQLPTLARQLLGRGWVQRRRARRTQACRRSPSRRYLISHNAFTD